VSSRRRISKTGSLERWGARAQVVVGTTRHEFAYRWTAPRSAASRALVVPLFLGAGLLVLLLGLLVLVAVLVVAALVTVAIALASVMRPFARRSGRARRDPRQ
jgi:hypothetical protein